MGHRSGTPALSKKKGEATDIGGHPTAAATRLVRFARQEMHRLAVALCKDLQALGTGVGDCNPNSGGCGVGAVSCLAIGTLLKAYRRELR